MRGINLDIMALPCVICKHDTDYDGYDDIKDMKYYIEGKGQLCKWCWDRRDT
jgi:hypothetical protein